MNALTFHEVADRIGVGSYSAVLISCKKFGIVPGKRPTIATNGSHRLESFLWETQVVDLIEARRVEGLRPKHQNRDAQRWARPGCTYDEPCIRCACEIVHGNAREEQS